MENVCQHKFKGGIFLWGDVSECESEFLVKNLKTSMKLTLIKLERRRNMFVKMHFVVGLFEWDGLIYFLYCWIVLLMLYFISENFCVSSLL